MPLLRKLRGKGTEPRPEATPIGAALGDAGVTELVHALLLTDATTQAAKGAMKRLCELVVDANELRVLMPEEIEGALGERYPAASVRARRIRAVLGDIHRRQHCVSLAHLGGASARDIRAYLESLEGVTHFAAARVALLGFTLPAIPVDTRLAQLLADEGVVEEGAPPCDIAAWIEKQIAASEAVAVHGALQAWSDEHGQSARSRERAAEPTPRKAIAPAKPAKATTKALAKPSKPRAAAGTSRTTKPKG
jgi:endonuclease III